MFTPAVVIIFSVTIALSYAFVLLINENSAEKKWKQQMKQERFS